MSKIANYSKSDLEKMDQRYRAQFINSLSGYKSANLIGTKNLKGQTNACIVSSVIHIGADPALVAFINRPHSVERHTLENILETKHYTINQVSQDFFEAAHHTSARYPRDISEFDAAGLDILHTDFPAPFVAQSNIRYGVRLVESLTLEVNKTVLVIGEIQTLQIASSVSISSDGKVDLSSAGTVCISGLDEYHATQSLGRLPYAKPKLKR